MSRAIIPSTGVIKQTTSTADIEVVGDVHLKSAGGADVPVLKLSEAASNGSNVVNIKAPTNLAADYTLTLPADDGTPNQILTTDGSGTLTWTTPGAGLTIRREIVTTQTITNTDTAVTDTLNFTPLGDIDLYLNGLLQIPGTGNDYTLSGSTITWLALSGTATDMETSDVLFAIYES